MHYGHLVKIDFGSLPHWIKERIQFFFVRENMTSAQYFRDWESNYREWFNTVPDRFKIETLKKSIEYGEGCLQYNLTYQRGSMVHFDEEHWMRILTIVNNISKETNANLGNTTIEHNIKFAGSKIDLIRILNALYELRKIEDLNGQVPPKKEFMISAGQFFNVNLANYDTSLSQAIKEGELEPNLEIFEKMKKVFQNIWHEKH